MAIPFPILISAQARGLAFATNDALKATFNVDGSFITGGIAGLVATTATYPLDLVRGRQAGQLGSRLNFAHAIVHFARTDGVTSLYRGAAPTLVGAIPFEGLKFGVFDRLQQSRSRRGPVTKAKDGAVAGCVAGLLTFPNDTIRRVLQQRDAPRLYRGYFDCAFMIVRTHGPTRLYSGLVPNLIKAVPSAGIQFFVFESLKPFVV